MCHSPSHFIEWVYVTGDVAGGEESPVYAIGKMSDAIDKMKLPDGYAVKHYKGTAIPERTDHAFADLGTVSFETPPIVFTA